MIDWIEVTATAVALLALAFSLVAFGSSKRSEKRELYVQLHELLTSPEIQEGRQLMYREIADSNDVVRLFENRSDGKYSKINRSVGMYNTLGIYLQQGYLQRGLVLDLWATRVREGWPQIELFLAFRRSQTGDRYMWSYLVWLGEVSEADVAGRFKLDGRWKKNVRNGTRYPPRISAEHRG